MVERNILAFNIKVRTVHGQKDDKSILHTNFVGLGRVVSNNEE